MPFLTKLLIVFAIAAFSYAACYALTDWLAAPRHCADGACLAGFERPSPLPTR